MYQHMGQVVRHLILTCLAMTMTSSVFAKGDVATLTEQDAIQKAKAYYDTKGEWAGKFTITKVHQVRFEIESAKSVVAHIRYQAAFLKDMTKTVEDQRTFGFSYDKKWQVDWMGGHKSASF